MPLKRDDLPKHRNTRYNARSRCYRAFPIYPDFQQQHEAHRHSASSTQKKGIAPPWSTRQHVRHSDVSSQSGLVATHTIPTPVSDLSQTHQGRPSPPRDTASTIPLHHETSALRCRPISPHPSGPQRRWHGDSLSRTFPISICVSISWASGQTTVQLRSINGLYAISQRCPSGSAM